MSTSIPPRPGDPTLAPRGSALPDEDALRASFFAEYPTLAAEARTRLGSEAAALGSRVVESAFLRAWSERERIETADQLHAFLHDETEHGAARALSRRAAAQRLAGHDVHAAHTGSHAIAEDGVEQSWTHLQHTLHGGEHRAEALAEAAEISRHGAAQHIAVLNERKSPWLLVAAGVVLAVAFVAVVMLLNRAGESQRVASALASSEARTVTTPTGRLGLVALPDSSSARLAPDSKLTIAKEFGAGMRAVKIEGAAAFTVAAAGETPFEVHARNAVVVATGTAFTVRAFPDESQTIVVVSEGSVELRRAGDVQTIAAGQGVVLGPGDSARAATDLERDAADGWRQGTLVINDRPMREVLGELKRWYGMSVTRRSSSAAGCAYTDLPYQRLSAPSTSRIGRSLLTSVP